MRGQRFQIDVSVEAEGEERYGEADDDQHRRETLENTAPVWGYVIGGVSAEPVVISSPFSGGPPSQFACSAMCLVFADRHQNRPLLYVVCPELNRHMARVPAPNKREMPS